MHLLNLENRASASNTVATELRAAAQTALKSLSSSLSTTFGKTLSEFEGAEGTSQNAATAAAARQNFVATLSSSRAALATTSPAVPSTESPESGSIGPLQQLVLAAEGKATTSTVTPATVTPTDTTTPSPSSPTSPTPTGPAAAPTLYSITGGPSSDPSVFTGSNYSEQLNYATYLQQANDENTLRYQNYTNEYQNWQLNGSQGQPPDAPVYETVDQNSFTQWYAQMTQDYSLGENAPDVSMFMTNGPDYGNGYYGAVGSLQVGSLYNPTGPPSSVQIQAAYGAVGNSNSNSTAT